MKSVLLLGVFLSLGFLGYKGIEYFAIGKTDTYTVIPSAAPNNDSQVQAQETEELTPPVSYKVEVVTENLFVPWSIVFTSDTRMLVTERNGKVRVIENGILRQEPLATFSEVSTTGEEGLMGLALDPSYVENKYLYLSYAYPKGRDLVVKVVRGTDEGSSLSDIQTLIDDIPAAQYHAGCRLRFGPDGKLYITTGDATDKNLAQDKNSLAGKILRLNSDGSVPSDNPFPNSPIYSVGHRNPQGIDWHPISRVLISTEHGPSLFDGPAGGDEVNAIAKGANYGWPIVSHEKSRPGLVHPLRLYTPAVAPGSGMFYTSDVFPQFRNSFFFGMLKGEGIMRIRFDESNPPKILEQEKITQVKVGRVREITQGPDGALYFSSSNSDGRGKTQTGDDKIYRLIPE